MNALEKIRAFIVATRPKTLAASIVPVLIGTAAAAKYSYIDIRIFILILICAVFIQILSNYFNELYDYKRGADTSERVGPQRMVASGIISPNEMSLVSIFLTIITFTIGLEIVEYSDIFILIVGILSLFFAFAYTGGPFPLAYKGLGEIFVFIFFGLVAVNGTFYVFTREVNLISLLSSLPPAFHSVNLLAINNIRDIETDRSVGKITLAVKIGRKNAIMLFKLFVILSYIPPIFLSYITNNFLFLLVFISIPIAVKLIVDITRKSGKELNFLIALNSILMLFFCLVFCLSFLL
ncbi:MAG TPA: 1,4-dihydroxy-2-naphthoate polyprenyltransferase [Candidatus Kapabacteria bacterium]|nr:1,4-dihydroxy-2-naphthoate polyprenyltransferase [Candidatus Kapabacteria bacterium]